MLNRVETIGDACDLPVPAFHPILDAHTCWRVSEYVSIAAMAGESSVPELLKEKKT
jgi:hypothetical protein